MTHSAGHTVTLLDTATAATLAQVLPVLLLTLAVEMRRTQVHRALSTGTVVALFLMFASIETVLVLSIDGEVYPFQWFDALSALIIFGMMTILSRLSLSDPPDRT